MRLTEYIDNYSKLFPRGEALIVQGKSISWKQLFELINKLDKCLAPYKNNRLLYPLSHELHSIALFLAANNYIGQHIFAANYEDENRLDEIAKQLSVNKIISIKNDTLNVIDYLPHAIFDTQKSEFCLLTSGTTGLPKCVKYNLDRLLNATKINPRFQGKRWLLAFPLAHFAGMRTFLQSYCNGGCIVIPDNFSPLTMRAAIQQNKVDYISCTPTLMRQLLMIDDFSWSQSLQHITLGGEIVDQSIIDLLKAKLPHVKITHIYAASEWGEMIVVKDQQAGFPSNLIDNKNFCIKEGQLYVHPSAGAMLGYLNKDLTIAEWAGTGDMVHVENDRVYFTGRIDDVINVGGYKIQPVMIENIIREMPIINDVAIVKHSNPIVGTLPKAIIKLNHPYNETDAKQEIIKHCKKKLPHHLVPRLFEFVEELPMNKCLKVVRR